MWALRLSAISLLCALIGVSAGEPSLQFEAPWVRALPPAMGMTAGFGTLRNPGPADIELVSFASPQFRDVSLHRSETVDGVSRMREVPRLSVPAGGAVELAPGGYHLMLMGPTVAITPGQGVALEMRAADGSVFRFEARVEKR